MKTIKIDKKEYEDLIRSEEHFPRVFYYKKTRVAMLIYVNPWRQFFFQEKRRFYKLIFPVIFYSCVPPDFFFFLDNKVEDQFGNLYTKKEMIKIMANSNIEIKIDFGGTIKFLNLLESYILKSPEGWNEKSNYFFTETRNKNRIEEERKKKFS